MPFDLVPPLGDSESAAVRAALATWGLALDSAPAAYGRAWGIAAAEEAAGYDTDDYADLASENASVSGRPVRPSFARQGVAER
jgi:hypothetical protein